MLPTHDDDTCSCDFDGTAGFETRPACGGALVTQDSPSSAESLTITVRPTRVVQCRPWDVTRGLGV